MDHAEERAKAVKVGRSETFTFILVHKFVSHIAAYLSHGCKATVLFLCMYSVILMLLGQPVNKEMIKASIKIKGFLGNNACHEVKKNPQSRWSLGIFHFRVNGSTLLVISLAFIQTEAPTKCSKMHACV